MNKYHINDKGETGLCEAQEGNCPFGDIDQHFSTPEEARTAYEEQMSKFKEFKNSPLGVLDKKMNSAIEKFKKVVVKTVDWLDDHPKTVIAVTTTVGTVVVGYLAYRHFSQKFATLSSAPFSGTIADSGRRVWKTGNVWNWRNDYQLDDGTGVLREFTEGGVGWPARMKEGTLHDLHLWSDGTVESFPINSETAPAEIAKSVGIFTGAGAAGGLVSGLLGTMGISKMTDYLHHKWNLRHERRYGLISWRSS